MTETGYPFVAIVVNQRTGHYESLLTLEKRGASEAIIEAIVHGPFQLAVKLVARWSTDFTLLENPAAIYEE